MSSFVKNVKLVEIEVFSHCNRRCHFCPNRDIDRLTENIHLSHEVYKKILGDLSRIEYSGTLSFSRYNEPLADEIIFSRIDEARNMLPHATLHTNTNSDFINKQCIDKLAAAGLDSLSMQIYLDKGQKLDAPAVSDKFAKLISKVKLTGTVEIDTKNRRQVRFSDSPIKNMVIRCIDFEAMGNSRGGLLHTIGDTKYTRLTPCSHPFDSMYIDYNGLVMPCCNLRSDSKEHSNYVVGDANQQSIIDIYSSQKLEKWRDSLNKIGPKKEPCTHCNHRDGSRLKRLACAAIYHLKRALG